MSNDRTRLEEFWRDRYDNLQRTDDGTVATWLDYSSDQTRGQRLQAQTQASVLEAIGTLRGQRLLDVGCGWGMLTLATAAFGARAVGLDILESAITKLKAEHPGVEWVVGNFLDPAVQSLLSLLVTFCFQPRGFANKDLRARFAHLLGVPPSDMTQGRMTYQLRRLRLRGFIERIKGSHRYRVTSTGMHVAIFATKLHARILRPGLSILEDLDATGDLRTLRSIDSAINSLVANARIAG